MSKKFELESYDSLYGLNEPSIDQQISQDIKHKRDAFAHEVLDLLPRPRCHPNVE